MSAASRMAKVQQRIEAQVGEPLVACMPGLAAWGATGAVAAYQVSGGLGWLKNDRANQAGGDAAGMTFAKNRYGLLALTTGGTVELFRTKMKRGSYEVEERVGVWARDQVALTIEPMGAVYKFTVSAADLPRPVELEIIKLGMGGLVADFAAKLCVPFADG